MLSTFLGYIGQVLTSAIGWVGDVVSSIMTSGAEAGALNGLLPFIAIGLGVGVLGLGVRYVRSFIKM